jgi:O-antigen chain-terminating methyltransferase
VLKPAGLLILETPNPENIVVSTTNFYLDPTHQRPIPPQLLAFLPEHYGFCRTKIMRLQESREIVENQAPTLLNVLNGASPDYAVVAQKEALPELLEAFDTMFAREYGLSLDALVMRYESISHRNLTEAIHLAKEAVHQTVDQLQQQEQRATAAEQRGRELEQRATAAEERRREFEQRATAAEQSGRELEQRAIAAETWGHGLEQRLIVAEVRLHQTEIAFASVRGSRSWRVTLPLRLAAKAVRWFIRGSAAWITFAPMSRPRLRAAGNNRQLPAVNVVEVPESLSPRARKIYRELISAVERRKGNH